MGYRIAAPCGRVLAFAPMSILQAIVLGAVQGITEFLPVSSSAHLFIIPRLLGWHYAGLGFDVALHWGTLIALLLSFGSTWIALARDAFSSDPELRREARTTWIKLIVASVPAVVVGLLLRHAAETWLRFLPLQAIMLVVFGFLLWWVDRVRPQREAVAIPGWGSCLAMGAAQALALVPGVSRSGVTITAGRARGENRVSAARFSFLLATPITMGAGLVELKHIEPTLSPLIITVGVATSAIVGWLAIGGLLRWLSRAGFASFFVYRVLVAAVIVAHLWVHSHDSVRPLAARQLVGKVTVQPIAQREPGAMQPRLDRSDRQVQHLGDLGVR